MQKNRDYKTNLTEIVVDVFRALVIQNIRLHNTFDCYDKSFVTTSIHKILCLKAGMSNLVSLWAKF